MRQRSRSSRAVPLLSLLLLSCCALPGSADADRQTVRIPAERPLRVGFLIVDGVYNTELAAPYDVFQHTGAYADPAMEVFTVSPDGEPITTAEGLRIVPDHSFATAPAIDVLVVPSAEGSRDRDLENAELIAWVRTAGEEASFVVSLCWGAFVLGQAELLDGRSATTFPQDYERFAHAFPSVDLNVNVSFVHDGPLLTSAGGAKSYDVAMYLVDLIFGEEVAQGIGSGLLIPWPPTAASRRAFVGDPHLRIERSSP